MLNVSMSIVLCHFFVIWFNDLGDRKTRENRVTENPLHREIILLNIFTFFDCSLGCPLFQGGKSRSFCDCKWPPNSSYLR